MKRLLVLLIFLLAVPSYAQQCSEDTQVARLSPAMLGSVPAAAGEDTPTFSSDFEEAGWSPPTTFGNWVQYTAAPADETTTKHNGSHAMRANANTEGVTKTVSAATEIWIDYWYYAVDHPGVWNIALTLYLSGDGGTLELAKNGDGDALWYLSGGGSTWNCGNWTQESAWYHIFLHINFSTNLVQIHRNQAATRDTWTVDSSAQNVVPTNLTEINLGIIVSDDVADFIFDEFRYFAQATEPAQW